MSVLSFEGLAKLLQCDEPDLYRRLPYLRRVGFPRHLPGLGLRWSEDQVLDWIASGGVVEPPPPKGPSGLRLVVDNANRALRARYVEGRK